MTITVVFEGLPGSGKTTVLTKVKKELQSRGLSVDVVDIDSASGSEKLHEVADSYGANDPVRILLLWAMRIKQYRLIKSLRSGPDSILVDRFFGTSIAYDVFGNGVPYELIPWVMSHNIEKPDITFLLEVPLDVAKARKEGRTTGDTHFMERVEAGYQKLADEYGWIRIDATRDEEAVAEECLHAIFSLL